MTTATTPTPAPRLWAPVRGIGIAASGGVALAMAATVGHALWPLAGWAAAKSRDSDLLFSVLDVGYFLWLAALVAHLVAMAPVVVWFDRARRNLDALPDARPALPAGWAVAGWFVPFANLVVPYRVMADIARASLSRQRTPVQVIAWWSGWLVFLGSWIGQQVDSYVRYSGTEPSFGWFAWEGDDALFQPFIDEYQRQLVPGLLMAVGIVVAGVALITLIRRISDAQQAGLAEM